jgi:hypothetical protein
MQRLLPNLKYLPVMVTLLLGACAHEKPLVMRPPPPALVAEEPPATPEEIEEVRDLMADVEGDRVLPPLGGAVERIDCKVGSEDTHARMALEARGGQVAGFAYYSKWRPRTCSMDMQHDDPMIKWRRTADGATRVQTPHGTFLIRALSGAYEVEFIDVERQRFCGMEGYTNGTMTVMRSTEPAECSVAGLMDRDDAGPIRSTGVTDNYK